MKYSYEVSGTAANDQTWATHGVVETLKPGDFMPMIDRAMRASFMDLTNGKAVFGQPGVGCVGPYSVTRMLIEVNKDS